MAQLFSGTPSGADPQSEAVRCYLQVHESIEYERWTSGSSRRVRADPHIFNYYNGRERGYVITLKSVNYERQLNVAFFQHRVSDEICALVWEQNLGICAPTINDAMEVLGDSFDVTHCVPFGKAYEMAEWIYHTLEDFWVESSCETQCQCAKKAKVVASD